MTIRRKLLVTLACAAAFAVVGALAIGWALGRMTAASRGWQAAEELRPRILQQALYVANLDLALEQSRPEAVEEIGRLLRRESEETDLLFKCLLDGDPRQRIPPLQSEPLRRHHRYAADLWPAVQEALVGVAAGHRHSDHPDLDGNCIELSNRVADLATGYERLYRSRAVWLAWATAVALGGLVASMLAFAWIVWRSVLCPIDRMGEQVRALCTGGTVLCVKIGCETADELGALSRAVNAFVERQRDTDQSKDRFLANMSHEIRTPMNGIIGFLENLSATELNEQQKQYVRVIQSSARALLRVINDVLDVSKLSAGRMELEDVAFDLEALARELVAVARQAARGKSVAVRLDLAPTANPIVRGDPTRLRQVLTNLLNNAVKFTEKGEVTLRVSFDQERDGRVGITFEVVDTGIGIHPDLQRRLFQPFSQGSSGVTRKYGGTGLGLCIAQNLVSLMGGQLRFESQLTQGTRFWFRIVTTTARPEEKVRLSEQFDIRLAPGVLKKHLVLVVDDNPTNLYLMETICQSIGLPYFVARNGKEAVDEARKRAFDLVFMDIQMPIMDGYTAIRAIRQIEKAAATQIIALTASALQEDVDRALGAGSTGFLAKPFERNQLLLCIAEHLGIPYERELKPMPDLHEAPADVSLRQVHDFMREQYQISLGEIKLILAQAVSNWRPQLQDILVFSKKGNWPTVRGIMHGLKGQLGAIGLREFAETADQVAVHIKNEQLDDLLPVLDEFVDELGSVFRAIEQETTQDQHVRPRAQLGTEPQ